MTPKNARFHTVSTWLGVIHGDDHYSGPNSRLEQDPAFKDSVYQWLRQAIPTLTQVSIQVYAAPERPGKASMSVTNSRRGRLASLICSLQIADTDHNDPTGEAIAIIRVVEAGLARMGECLAIRQPAPKVMLLADEAAWLQKHGEPKVHVGDGPVELTTEEAGEPHSFQPRPTVDVWGLFPGELEDPIMHFRRKFSRLPTRQRKQAATAIRWYIDGYMEAYLDASEHGCVSDSEAVHAAAILCGGKQVWEQAIANPNDFEDVWPADDDAEEILEIVEWT